MIKKNVIEGFRRISLLPLRRDSGRVARKLKAVECKAGRTLQDISGTKEYTRTASSKAIERYNIRTRRVVKGALSSWLIPVVANKKVTNPMVSWLNNQTKANDAQKKDRKKKEFEEILLEMQLNNEEIQEAMKWRDAVEKLNNTELIIGKSDAIELELDKTRK